MAGGKKEKEKIKLQKKRDHTYCNYTYIRGHQHLQRKDYRQICLLAREIQISMKVKEQMVGIK